jgi:hypothetical protein
MTDPQRMNQALEPTSNRDWIMEEDCYDPLREASRGARFAISNGFLGVRGARAIHRGGRWVDTSHTLVAGLFDTPDDEQAIPGLVATPDWLQVQILLEGEPLVHRPGDGESQRRILDMRRGTLITEDRLFNAAGVGVRLRSLHIVSLGQRSIGLQLLQLEIEQEETVVTVNASFEGLNIGLKSERIESGLGVWHAISTGKRLAIAAGLTLRSTGGTFPLTAVRPLNGHGTGNRNAGRLLRWRVWSPLHGAIVTVWTRAGKRGTRLASHVSGAGPACWLLMRRRGCLAGTPATSRSREIPPHNGHCGSRSTT